jgi:hypothetical protein
MLLSLLLLQAAAQPDIEVGIRARARSVEIERKGETSLSVTAEPDGGSRVESRVTPKANARTKLRNIEVDIRGAASIAAPGGNERGETSRPQ